MDMKEIEKEDVRSFADLVNILKPEDKDLNVQFGYGEFVDDWGERDTWLVSKVKELTPQEAGRTETFDGDEGDFVLQIKTLLYDANQYWIDQLEIDNLFNLNWDIDLQKMKEELDEKYRRETGSDIAESSTDSTDVSPDI